MPGLPGARTGRWRARLLLLFLASVALRVVLAWDTPSPWVFTDELVHIEMARSFAASASFSVRGGAEELASRGYPLLLSPAFVVFGSQRCAYLAILCLNGVLMSTAVFPAWLLARSVLRPAQALAVAALAVAVPSMGYTRTVLGESAFYPLLLLAALAVQRVLVRPSAGTQAVCLLAILAAFAVRAQALALLAGHLLALLWEAWTRPVGPAPVRLRLGGLRRYGWTGTYLATGALIVSLGALLADWSPLALLGKYVGTLRRDDVAWSGLAIAEELVLHTAELGLLVGVVPLLALFALLPLASRAGRGPSSPAERASDPARAFALLALATALCLLGVVAVFAARFPGHRIEERQTFYLTPLLLIALFLWVQSPSPGAPALALLGASLPFLLPVRSLLTSQATDHDTLLLGVLGHVFPPGAVTIVLILLAGSASLAFALLPVARRTIVPACVGALFVALSGVHHGIVSARSAAAAHADGLRDPSWIDLAVPPGTEEASVSLLHRGPSDQLLLWVCECFNASLGPVFALDQRTRGSLRESAARIDAQGGILRVSGPDAPTSALVVAPPDLRMAGELLFQEPGCRWNLWRAELPWRVHSIVEGLFADEWSGPRLAFRCMRCTGQPLSVTLLGDASLGLGPQTVVVRTPGSPDREHLLTPPQPLHVELSPGIRDGAGLVEFLVSPTAVPDDVLGNGDRRELGALFTNLRHEHDVPPGG